jgi:hypothetical protein
MDSTGVLKSDPATSGGGQKLSVARCRAEARLYENHRVPGFLHRPLGGQGLGLSGRALRWTQPLKWAQGGTALAPSPGPPRLEKAPAAVHPLPQGGEGGHVVLLRLSPAHAG